MSTNNILIEKCTNDITKAKILYVTQSYYDSEWTSTIHEHRCTELFYVTKGTGYFQIKDETIQVKADDIIIINPSILHTEKGIPGHAFEYIVMGIEDFVLQKTKNEGYFFSNYSEYKHEVLFYLKTLLIEARKKEEGYQQMCQCLLVELIINILRRANSHVEVAHIEKQNLLCISIENYIEAHFKENITLDDLSKYTYASKYHIVHSFTSYKGIAPIAYVLKRRIEESKHLLINTDFMINEIASSVGFSSVAYYIQTFNKFEHTSPGRYRKLHQTKKVA